MVRSDSLGQSYSLTGFQAFCSVNNVLRATSGTVVADAPALTTPAGISTVTITLTASSFSVAYTATPLATGVKAIIRCSPQRSAGRGFEADYRIVHVTTAAAASPANILTAYTAKFGVPVVGNKIFTAVTLMQGGFESLPLITAQAVA
jgi:hypothetical protein